MSRKETKEYFEKKGDYHQVAMMEFTDLLKQEHKVDSDKIPAYFYDVLGMVLTRFEERINSLALPKDTIFINHIQAHLNSNEKVICKVCGRTAEDIIKEAKETKKDCSIRDCFNKFSGRCNIYLNANKYPEYDGRIPS